MVIKVRIYFSRFASQPREFKRVQLKSKRSERLLTATTVECPLEAGQTTLDLNRQLLDTWALFFLRHRIFPLKTLNISTLNVQLLYPKSRLSFSLENSQFIFFTLFFYLIFKKF